MTNNFSFSLLKLFKSGLVVQRNFMSVLISFFLCSTLVFTSCTKDFECAPIDDQSSNAQLKAVTAFPTGTHSKLTSTNSSWDATTKTFTIFKSVSFGADADKDAFIWVVPTEIQVIKINGNGTSVTVTGGFKAKGKLSIQGSGRTTSKIYGTVTKDWAGTYSVADGDKYKYGGFHVDWSAPIKNSDGTYVLYEIKDITIENSRTYAVTAYNQKLVASNIHIKNTRTKPDYHSNSDGFGGGIGSIIKNSRIDTWDDGVKLYKNNINVENVTIVHNSNGAPFQLGWGQDTVASTHKLTNVLIVVNNASYTNCALFNASLTSGKLNRTVNIAGLKAVYASTQKLKNFVPSVNLPLVYLESKDAKLKLQSVSGANINLSAPQGKYGPGVLTVSINGITTVQGSYSMGTSSSITGCGFE